MLFEDGSQDSQGDPKEGSRKPDFSAKFGAEYIQKLDEICRELKTTKTEFFKRKIHETWLKISYDKLFDKLPEE
ncbi:MAG: hypothetical protein ABSG94_12210 [Brevinematales bacterium]|jgi:hypothetical protein